MAKHAVEFVQDPSGDWLADIDGRFSARQLMKVIEELQQRGNVKRATRQTDSQITVISGVSSRDYSALVTMEGEVFDAPVQLTSVQALDLGHSLMEASQISLQESLMCSFFVSSLHFDQQMTANILFGLRKFREKIEEDDEPNT